MPPIAQIVVSLAEFFDSCPPKWLQDFPLLYSRKQRRLVRLNGYASSPQSTDSVLSALFPGLFYSNLWMVRQRCRWPCMRYFQEEVDAVTSHIERGQLAAAPWSAWRAELGSAHKNLGSNVAVVITGNAPHALWMYAGQKLSVGGRDVTLINFPVPTDAGKRGVTVYHLSENAAPVPSLPKYFNVQSDVVDADGSPLSNAVVFAVTMNPQYAEGTLEKAREFGPVHQLIFNNHETLQLDDRNFANVRKEIEMELEKLAAMKGTKVYLATSGADVIAFFAGSKCNPNMFTEVSFLDYANGKYILACER